MRVEATVILALAFIIPEDTKGRFCKGEKCSCQPQLILNQSERERDTGEGEM
jgi:hypothetical protein